MKLKEFVTAMELAKTFPPKKERAPAKKKDEDKPILMQLIEQQQQWEAFQKFLKDQEKINKKEDKKDDKKAEGMSFIHLVMVFMIGSMFQAPFMLYFAGRLTGKW